MPEDENDLPGVDRGYEGLPDDYDAELIDRCRQIFAANVTDVSRVRFLLTSDFVGEVKKVHPNPAYAASYDSARLSGTAAAKVIPQPDGTIDVVVDVSMFHSIADPVLAEQTFLHEAVHVGIKERGESPDQIRDQLHEVSEGIPAPFLDIAAIAAEECRVEQVVTRSSSNPRWSITDFETYVKDFNDAAHKAVVEYQASLDVEALCRKVTLDFSSLATAAGYLAAELKTRTTNVDELMFTGSIDEAMLGPEWRELVVDLQTYPPGDQPIKAEDFARKLLATSALVGSWLEKIGFSITSSAGIISFEILKPIRWVFPINLDL